MTLPRANRRQLLTGAAGALTAASLAGQGQAAGSGKPNIIFIMADDMGYADVGVYGARGHETPNLDALAADGMMFTQGYANAPICSPTRVGLLTGRYQQRVAVGLPEPIGKALDRADRLDPKLPTLASQLRKQGYATHLVGKWHVGTTPQDSPLLYGYDHYYAITAGAADYFRHRIDLSRDNPGDGLYADDKPVQPKGYLTDILTNEAIKVVEGAGSRPFFLSLHYNAPHWPWEGPEDEAVAATLSNAFHPDGGDLQTYGRMIAVMDAGIGRLRAALKARGLDQNTLIVFTSDNGGERFSDTWPFTGMKGELLEGGVRVPLVFVWPGHIAPGSKSDQVAISMDMLPTFMAASGGRPDASYPTDGDNLLPVLLGQTRPYPRKLFWRYKAGEQASVRDGDWKYLKIKNYEHLYDVAKDPRERAELKAKHPEVFARLKAEWQAWNASMLPYGPDTPSAATTGLYGDRF